MAEPLADVASRCSDNTPSARIDVSEIARRLGIGRLSVYAMLEQGVIPGIRLGRRWIITRAVYKQWEGACGVKSITGLASTPEVSVVVN